MLRRLRWRAYQLLRRPSIVCNHPLGYRLRLEFSDVAAPALYDGWYEEAEVRKVVELVQPGMTVLDIGAHIGYFTLLMAVRVGRQGKVYAFEPNPRMCAKLAANVELNSRSVNGRVLIRRLALSAQDGEAEFFCPVAGYEGVGGLKDTKRAPVGAVARVRVRTLDSFIEDEGITKVDFIKMDIEGGEFDALRGAERTLAAMRPTVLFEASDLNTVPYGYRAFQLLDHLEERGYALKQIGQSDNFLATPI